MSEITPTPGPAPEPAPVLDLEADHASRLAWQIICLSELLSPYSETTPDQEQLEALARCLNQQGTIRVKPQPPVPVP